MLLYTNGCSFTYGDELQYPQQDAWPYVLGRLLQCHVINSAKNGGNIFRVLRQTINFLYLNLDQLNDLFIIICWPPFVRIEAYDKNNKQLLRLTKNTTELLRENDSYKINNMFLLTKPLLYCMSYFYYLQYTLHFILISYNIPHIFFNAKWNHTNIFQYLNSNSEILIKNVIQQNKEIADKHIFLKNSSFEEFTNKHKYAKGINSHPLEEAHLELAKLLYQKYQQYFK